MSRRNEQNPDPNGKGENWPKFLKQMQTLEPILNQRLGGVAPDNRAQARTGGRKNVLDFLEKATAKLADQQAFRDYKVNEWFDKNLLEVAPRLFSMLVKSGGRYGWMVRMLGYKLTATDGMEMGVPFTVCTITRFGRLKVGLRMFWEDPKKKGLKHERK